MKTTKDIAQALLERREQLGLGQKDIKGLIGMSQQQYSKAETSGEISLKTLLKILDALELDMTFIPKESLQKEAVLSEIKQNTSLSDLVAISKKINSLSHQLNPIPKSTQQLINKINQVTEPSRKLSKQINQTLSPLTSYTSKLEALKDDD